MRIKKKGVVGTPRQMEALSWRRLGYSYDRIALEMGISSIRASQLVHNALDRYNKDIAKEIPYIRDLELSRLDHLLTCAYEVMIRALPQPATPQTPALPGDPEIVLKAIARAESLIMQRAKICGLDVIKIEASVEAPWKQLLAESIVVTKEPQPALLPAVSLN